MRIRSPPKVILVGIVCSVVYSTLTMALLMPAPSVATRVVPDKQQRHDHNDRFAFATPSSLVPPQPPAPIACYCSRSATPKPTDYLPIGDGDAAALVACSQSSVFMKLRKSDAFDDSNFLLSLGTVQVDLTAANSTTPVVLSGCMLYVTNATIVLRTGGRGDVVRVYFDDNSTLLVDHGSLQVTATSTNVRTNQTMPLYKDWERQFCKPRPHLGAFVLQVTDSSISWMHQNNATTWHSEAAQRQPQSPLMHDPLANLSFGVSLDCDPACRVPSPGMPRLVSTGTFPRSVVRMHFTSSTPPRRRVNWSELWQRSTWVMKSQPAVADAVNYHRYLISAQAYGTFPVKFNGGLYVADEDRMWGGFYWWQNTRLMYLPALQFGDTEHMASLYDMYTTHAFDNAVARCSDQHKSECAYFYETMSLGGYASDGGIGYGCDGLRKRQHPALPPTVLANTFTRYLYTGGVELLHMMVDHVAFDPTDGSVLAALKKLARPIVSYYTSAYGNNSNNEMYFYPANSLETYQCENPASPATCTTANPLPDIAALRVLMPSLSRLVPESAAYFGEVASRLPPLPMKAGNRSIAPALRAGATKNVENVALYAVHPYRLHKRGLVTTPQANQTYKERPFKCNAGWCQDILDAALLGASGDLAKMTLDRITSGVQPQSAGYQFPWFAPAFQDALPNMEHFSVMTSALQLALLQWGETAEDNSIVLFPAWPCEWDVATTLYAPNNTVVQIGYDPTKSSKLYRLNVVPEERKKDVVIAHCV